MAIIYLNEDGVKVRKHNGRLEIVREEAVLHSVPLQLVEKVIVCANAQLSTQLIFELIGRKIPLSYINLRNSNMGVVVDSEQKINVLKKQVNLDKDENKKINLAAQIIMRKLAEQQKILNRYARRKNDKELLQQNAGIIGVLRRAIPKKKSVDEIRGIEGFATRKYFECFNTILGGTELKWEGRYRRPASDPINSLLSFGYTLLTNEVNAAILTVGLNPYFGIIHTTSSRRPALVMDLIELFRQPVVDRLVLGLLNRKQVKSENFQKIEGKMFLTAEGRKSFIAYFEKFMVSQAEEKVISNREWILAEARSLVKQLAAETMQVA